MSRLCRLGVQSAHEKSLLLLGLISDKFAQRMHASAKLAEGEELASNLLQACLRSSASNYANGIPALATKHTYDLIFGVP